MTFLESTMYVIGFLLIWGSMFGLVYLVDNYVVKPIRGTSYINPEYWK